MDNWLPTTAVLAARKVPVSSLCFLCNSGVETLVHALWGCCTLKAVRRSFPQLAGLVLYNEGSFLDFIRACQSVFLEMELEELCVVWWRAWFRRNKAYHTQILWLQKILCRGRNLSSRIFIQLRWSPIPQGLCACCDGRSRLRDGLK
ncbi:hypothetical protein ACOSQ2_033164 [Xanthoceras sorbifolium]